MDDRQRSKKVFVGDLPQWNSRFGFSAQRQPAQKKDQPQGTPNRLGQARRVPVPAAGGPVDRHHAEPKGTGKANSAGDATPLDANKTPTVCLFERFERLTLNGATPITAPGTVGAAAPGCARVPALETPLDSASSILTASSGDSEQFAGRARPARRSVAFGTPSVLTYTPAGPVAAAPEGDDNTDSTPLWSNAGHTPYSLAGSSSSSGASGGGRIQVLAEDDDDDVCHEADCPLITAAAGVQRAGRAGRPSSNSVCMELFTTVIHGAPQDGAEHTPAGAVALRCPKTPVDDSHPQRGSSGKLGSQATAASSDDSSQFDCYDMELQTPATQPTATSKALAGVAAPDAAGSAAAAAMDAGAIAAALLADSPSGSSSFTGFAGGASTGQQVGSITPTLFNHDRKGATSTSRPLVNSLQQLLAGGSHSSDAAARSSLAATSELRVPAAGAATDAGSQDAGVGEGRSSAGQGASSSSSRSQAVTPQQHQQECSDEHSPEAAGPSDGAGGGVGGLRLPATTPPKSKLRQPERVAVEARMPVPTELSKLLDDADAAAAAAAVLGRDHQAALGSCEVLSPVRARRQVQQALGATEQVLTPVRRSARKVKYPAAAVHLGAPDVQPMLEATNYCYQPNQALPKQ